MKIVVLSRGCPSKKDPQWGSFEKDQALALQQLGHNVCLASIDGRVRFYYRKWGISYRKYETLPVYNAFYLPDKCYQWLGGTAFLRFKQFQLRRLFRRIHNEWGKPDVVYAHYFMNIALSVTLKKEYNIPIVGIEHASLLQKPKISRHVDFLARYAYLQSDVLLTVSQGLQESIINKFDKHSTIIPNMVNSLFFNTHLTNQASHSVFKIVSIGSLIYRKGFDVLIEAMTQLSMSSFHLTIIGGGQLYRPLQKKIIQLGLENKVSLTGQLPSHQIISILKESDLLVSSSRSETFGVTLLEGMALGLPVVATRCGGPEYFITPEVGLIVEKNNPLALAKAIDKARKGDYNNQKIQTYCQSHFSANVVAKQIENILYKVIQK